MLTPASVFQRNPDFIARKIGGETVLIPLQKKIYDISSIYNLNELASLIWERLDGARSLQDIQDELTNVYDVSAEKVSEDLKILVEQLQEIKAVFPHEPQR